MRNLYNMTISDMIGKTPLFIIQGDDDTILFKFSDGTQIEFYHAQNCCESVIIEDVNGDWSDLVGQPILEAREVSNDAPPLEWEPESYTWTFYTFRGIKGSVDVRWYGTSNGYYSESVYINWSEWSPPNQNLSDLL